MQTIRGDERGLFNVLIIPVVVLAVLFTVTAGFAYWSYMGRQDYKNHSDKKVAIAVQANTEKIRAEDNQRFAEEQKKPYKDYVGPESLGSIHLSYPKTWSAYVQATDRELKTYFEPNYVRSTTDKAAIYALRVDVVNISYSNAMQQFQAQVKQKLLTATPYSLPRNPSVVGTRLNGQIEPKKQGSVILLPLRDKTIRISTEAPDTYMNDFNNIILPNLSFTP